MHTVFGVGRAGEGTEHAHSVWCGRGRGGALSMHTVFGVGGAGEGH